MLIIAFELQQEYKYHISLPVRQKQRSLLEERQNIQSTLVEVSKEQTLQTHV